MTRIDSQIDRAFSALSHRMNDLGAPGRGAASHEPIASLIDKVNAAKLRYQPGAR
ncbi:MULTISPECIES: hypothetical protein [unclassified Sphingobium]|jgi:hypothetical protein|uniref:hypothetical protein n=1 Tax=unclassified Sphingobium TaxID=2611147 RepID=UPI000A45B920|nr:MULTISPECIES: hypothetical protein [unclassified Sphingobium]WIW88287.1 hypothetical protein K3M67_15235 [Sphingobium sp. V4]